MLIHEFYLRTTTVEILARRYNCSRDTIYARLHKAHVEIMGSLNDMAAGCFNRDPLDTSDKAVQYASNL